MAGKFLTLVNGRQTEEAAINSSAGAGDADKIPKLDAAGKISSTMMPTGIGPETRTLTASEALSAGDLVNFWDDSGTLKMRKADADADRQADGFVLASVSSGASGTVYPEEGVITGLSSLTIGATYWLSATAGGITTTSPTGNNVLSQIVGKALSATELLFKPEAAIKQVA